jgi:hypothetical protein
MSQTARHESKSSRRLCETCRERKARFRFRGVVKANKDHTLCFECFRSERDRRRAGTLNEVERPRPALTLAPMRQSLTAAQISHRQRMVAHLSGELRRGSAIS